MQGFDESRLRAALYAVSGCGAILIALASVARVSSVFGFSAPPMLAFAMFVAFLIAIGLLLTERYIGSRNVLLLALLWLWYALVLRVGFLVTKITDRLVFSRPAFGIVQTHLFVALIAAVLGIATYWWWKHSDEFDLSLQKAAIAGFAVAAIIVPLGPILFNGDRYGFTIPFVGQLVSFLIGLVIAPFGLDARSCGIDSCWYQTWAYPAAAFLFGVIVVVCYRLFALKRK